MTNRIGNKDVAQHRSKADKKAIKKMNIEREAIKRTLANSRYHNAVKNQPTDGL